MDSALKRIFDLIKYAMSFSGDDSYTLNFTPTDEEKGLIAELVESNSVQEIVQNGKVISVDEINGSQPVVIEIIHFELQRYGYYHTFDNLISHNEFSAPEIFYVKDLDYFHGISPENKLVISWFTIVELIECLSGLSIFQSNDDGKTLYFMQEKSATVLNVFYDRQLIDDSSTNSDKVSGFIKDVASLSDKKKIYVKELIDYLNTQQAESRFNFLCQTFSEFYRNCEAAYGFFLSDFSYSKLKLELESAILDYSKNIRSIINDSQSRLIAIPAAFLVASTQLDLNAALATKNILIIVSSFVFSLLIEVFIKNQESSLIIFVDNIKNYKTTFKLKNATMSNKENDTLQSVISSSFLAIDDELKKQKVRLKLVRCINWGMSIFLVFIVITIFKVPPLMNIIKGILHAILPGHTPC